MRATLVGAIFFSVILAPVLTHCGEDPMVAAKTTHKYPYALKVDLPGVQGTAGDATGLVVVGRGKLNVKTSLLYHTTGKPIVAELMKKEKPLLGVFVTEFEPVEYAELESKPKLHSQPYDAAISVPIPDNYVNQKVKLFFTLVRNDVKEKTTDIVETTPVEFYVDASGAGMVWVSGAQFVPAAKDAVVNLEVKALLNGAELSGTPTAEYTTDGSAWQAIAIENWQEKPEQHFTFTVKYPFADERHFRLRLKAKDTLGNESTSAASPGLVGRPATAQLLTVPQAERSACKVGQKNASHLDLVLASRVLCRAKSEDGSLTSDAKVALFAHNRGLVPLTFPADVQTIAVQVNYTINGESDVRYFDIPHAPLSAADFTGTAKVLYVPLEIDRVKVASAISLQMDRNAAAKYSTSGTTAQTSTCYPSTEPVPTVLLKQAGTLDLFDSALACDE